MNNKVIQGTLIASLSIASIILLFTGYMGIAALLMTVLFFLTNRYRYKQMKAQGMEREAKWMFGMTVIFGILFFVVLGTLLI